MFLDYFALFVLAALVAVAAFVIWKLGELPGRIAKRREHPQADAITVCGWLGVLSMGLLWPVAFVWAYLKPAAPSADTGGSSDVSGLRERLELLEARIETLIEQGGAQ